MQLPSLRHYFCFQQKKKTKPKSPEIGPSSPELPAAGPLIIIFCYYIPKKMSNLNKPHKHISIKRRRTVNDSNKKTKFKDRPAIQKVQIEIVAGRTGAL